MNEIYDVSSALGLISQSVREAKATASADNASTNTVVATKLTQSPTPTGATRTLDTPFQIDPNYPALVFYTIDLAVSFSLLSSQYASVQMLSDLINPPTSLIGEVKLLGSQLLGLGVTISNTSRQVLVGYIPAGQYVTLTTSGAGTATLINSIELLFNA